ncbi:NAD(P)-binding protein [Lojkania enalia]|uniref:NAD(P)-binding protein n=1 Tax=Lojkania enalia TaxID=147567 RepID=A0A9P4K283_9PLEO|nr:NAD(P)-binding protein [Didymosphaeria enalia]
MPIQNVALIGASGTLGPSILQALKASPFTPFVLNRASSTSIYPFTNTLTIPDDLDVPALTSIFQENKIDALIIAIAGSHVTPARKLIDAAFASSVQRIIPAEFGSCDSNDAETNALLPLMAGKKQIREYLILLSSQDRLSSNTRLSWTALVTGHFFDYGLSTSLMKFDVRARKAYVLDGGDVAFSASNLDFIARATVKALEKEQETRNRLLYVHSHSTTQNEVLKMFERIEARKWDAVHQSSKALIEEARPRMLDGDHEATEEVVSAWGIVGSDWRGKEGFANELLGLQEEDLESVLRRVLEDVRGVKVLN